VWNWHFDTIFHFGKNFKILIHFDIAIFTQIFRLVTPATAALKEKHDCTSLANDNKWPGGET
jgi:hypothetical protein